MATAFTFFVSALAHELVLACITKKLRGYGAIAMMLQMPLVMAQRSRWVRGRTLLNVSFENAAPLRCPVGFFHFPWCEY